MKVAKQGTAELYTWFLTLEVKGKHFLLFSRYIYILVIGLFHLNFYTIRISSLSNEKDIDNLTEQQI